MRNTKAILAIADAAVVAGTLLLAVALRMGWRACLDFARSSAPHLLAMACIFPVVFYIGGLYDTRRLRSAAAALVPAALAVSAGALLGGAYLYITWSPPVGRGIAVAFGLLLYAAVMFIRWTYARLSEHGVFAERCLVVGTHEEAQRVADVVRAHADAGIRVVGRIGGRDVGRDEQRTGQVVLNATPLLGELDALEAIVEARRVDRIVLAPRLRRDPALLRRLRPLRYTGVALMDLAFLYEELAREIPLGYIDEEWLFHAALANSRLHIRRLKRVSDTVGSLILLVPTIPVLAIAALAIKLSSRGPVLFRQERVGLRSKPFMVLKLRTMYEDAEKLTGPVWSSDHDPRITPVGRILRKFRIDELPQIFNVLRGEMSLVGPRPERPVFVQKLTELTPFYSERVLVRPGITGWAQVMAPYASTMEDSIRKLQFDLYYAKHVSLALDFLILVKTVRTILLGREREQGGMRAGEQAANTPLPVPMNKGTGS